MRILYVASKYDYGDPGNGWSYEHWNFHESLVAMGHELLYFDFPTLMKRHGRAAMNRRLVEVARARNPELMFSVLAENEFAPGAIRAVTDEPGITTANWFCDDHWRFSGFTRHWAPRFDWAITTSRSALAAYREHAIANVLKSQWACNPRIYRKSAAPLARDVAFVGLPYGERPGAIAALRSAGHAAEAWGRGWPNGRLTQEGMVEVFSSSRINLNFSSASAPRDAPPPLSAARLGLGRLARRIPGVAALARGARALSRRAQARPEPALHPAQIKGRVFEVAACGGFLLTQDAEDLSEYFAPGREIALFDTPPSLLAAVRHFLDHEEERASVAAAGEARVLREHTYEQRFSTLFRSMGLPSATAARQGSSEDVA